MGERGNLFSEELCPSNSVAYFTGTGLDSTNKQ